ncbi:MAG TPA: hypothetical protein VIS27_08670 [Yeosuana sp.]
MGAYTELFMDQGATFNSIIDLTDDVTNAAVNLVGYNVSSQMRKSYYAANSSANLTCAITDATNGEITIFLSKDTTANLSPGRYVFDVLLEDDEAANTRILEGIITVTPGVTR